MVVGKHSIFSRLLRAWLALATIYAIKKILKDFFSRLLCVHNYRLIDLLMVSIPVHLSIM